MCVCVCVCVYIYIVNNDISNVDTKSILKYIATKTDQFYQIH